MVETLPYGTWPSPLSADLLATAGVGLGAVALDGDAVWWTELRPAEGGRTVLVRQVGDGPPTDVTPEDHNVRTLAHEYGGGDFVVHDGTVWYANFADQRVYRQRPTEAPVAVTPEPVMPGGDRYADFDLSPDGRLLYAVLERHTGAGEPTNAIVVLPSDGSAAPVEVAGGHDFCAAPRVSPDGRHLAWLTWDHPDMPWDGTVLHVAAVAAGGTLDDARRLLGGRTESVQQPLWSPDGALHVLSDRTGWWNLHRVDLAGGDPQPLHRHDVELGVPPWRFGYATYAFLDDGRVVCLVHDQGVHRVMLLAAGPDPAGAELADAGLPWRSFRASSLRSDGRTVVFSGATPTEPNSVVRWDLAAGRDPVVLRRAFDPAAIPGLGPEAVSVAEQVTFPARDGGVAHALYYPPHNPAVRAPDGELPPLIVSAHGGPTSEADAGLSLATQYWTSRGFAVCDVNYRGSTGYGRAYRDKLKGTWGLVDIEDCVDAARHLAERGLADPDRLAVTGGSAGGFVVMAALAFHDVFAAGVSHFGVADLGLLAEETHKFESRYLDQLVGPWPQDRGTYEARSPLHHADRITVPLLLLQGMEDAVVPPSQTEQMAAALAAGGTPHATVYFDGEQHGWRRAETIRAAVEAELAFYGQVLGFTPADDVAPVTLR
jgi:dipeptidyl aminopeptidase/acylaminoacyl peptidase